jgi:hypothetical protein
MLGAAWLQTGFLCICLFAVAAGLRCAGASVLTAVLLSLPAVALAAMLAFWLTWLLLPGQGFANAVRVVLIFCALAAAATLALKGYWRDEIVLPLLAVFAATMTLLLWAHAGSGGVDPLLVAAQRWTHRLPGDNELPLLLAQGIQTGSIPHPLTVGGWLSSDRPPLQTAMFLITPGFLLEGATATVYQAAGVGFQMTVLLGVWVLARALGAGRGIAIGAMIASFFTPITLVNGVFVWPKLLAAAFVSFAVALHFLPEPGAQKRPLLSGAATGLCSALAMLTHGSSAFALMGMAIAAALRKKLGSFLYIIGVLVTAVAIYAPWLAYQAIVDPPGNVLIKRHLAGVSEIDSRSAVRTIIDSYRSSTLEDVIASKEANVAILFTGIAATYRDTLAAANAALDGQHEKAAALLRQARHYQFFCFVVGMGLLGLSFLILPFGLLDPRSRDVVLVVLASVVAWVALMFRSGDTIIHQGSYFPELATTTLAVVYSARVAIGLACLLVGAHVAITIFQYTF